VLILGVGGAGAWRTWRARRSGDAKRMVVKLPPVVATPTKAAAPTGEPDAPEDEETTAENTPETGPAADEPIEQRVAPGKARAVRRPPARIVHKAPKPQKGLLSVNAIPWANLYVDGKPAGHTPKLKLPLEAGRHSLKLVTQAGESRTRAIEINPNKETTLTVVFSEP
jgi:hypothetical protein